MHLLLHLSAFLLIAAPCEIARAGQLRAGAAKIDITPTPDELPYVSDRERPFVAVHDPLYSRALVLEDGTTKIAIVIVDVTTIPMPRQMVRDAAAAIGIPVDHLMLAASNTHEVPLVSFHVGPPNARESAEIRRIHDATLQALRQADRSAQPAVLAVGHGEAFVNINNGERTGLAGRGDPRAPSDKSLDVVRVNAIGGGTIALLITYADHAEVMFRSLTKDGGYEVSGDLPGVASQLLEGPAAKVPVVLFASGPAGDQRPLFTSLHTAGRLPQSDEGAAGWALLNAQARTLAESTMDILATMPPGTSEVRLAGVSRSLICPGNDRHLDESDPRHSAPVAIPLQVIRMNDLALAGIGGDVASEIGMRLKEAVAPQQVMMITKTAGSIGYILPDEAYAISSHGTSNSPIQPGCAATGIVRDLAEILRQQTR